MDKLRALFCLIFKENQMRCQIFAIGQKMPKWCTLACEDYLSRLQHFMKCTLTEIATATRFKSGSATLCKEEEGSKILQRIDTDDFVVALEVTGKAWSTATLANQLAQWKQSGQDLVFVIGGPDGLSQACLTRANLHLSLSALTFPHVIARVLLLEQLYRASSMLANHPYHRE